jgi:hypothetical protein
MANTELVVTKIGVLVHPDWHLVGSSGWKINANQLALRARQEDWALDLAANPEAVLMNFSSFSLELSPRRLRVQPKSAQRENICQIEKQRRENFSNYLGERYFCFGYTPNPAMGPVTQALLERNVKIAPSAIVEAGGEYQEICVDIWSEAVLETFRLSRARRIIREDLCFSLDKEWSIRIQAIEELKNSIKLPSGLNFPLPM